MSRTLRSIASALFAGWILVAASAAPAAALVRSGRPGHEGPSRPAERTEPGAFAFLLLRLFDFVRGTMDPNGGS